MIPLPNMSELTDGIGNAENDAVAIPDGFGGISFKDWLEVFLEYGLSLAYDGRKSQAYQIMVSATQANVFYHSPDSLFLIHVCWFSKLSWNPESSWGADVHQLALC